MKLSQATRKLLAAVLIVAWVAYAGINLFASSPYLASAYLRTPGSLAAKLGASAEAANGKIVWQSRMQDAVGDMRRLLDQQAIDDFTLVKGQDGQLIYSNFYPYEAYAGLDAYAQRMQVLSDFAQAQDASFLFLNCIALYNEETDAFGGWPVNNLNPRSDAFLYHLSGYEVAYLDARAVLRQSSLEASQYRYRTEPHWTTQACYEVFIALVGQLKAQGSGIDPDGFYTDRANYSRTLYAQSYLGKLGKIAGATYAGYDDFVLIEPTFATDFTISYSRVDDEDDVRGDFSGTILDAHWMSDADPYENDLYCLYLSEVYSYRKITNHRNTEGPKMLVVGDSYMLPVTAFLATAASEIHLLSPYDLPADTPSLLAYIEENDIDHVVVGLNPGALYNTGWNFLTGIEPAPITAVTLAGSL